MIHLINGNARNTLERCSVVVAVPFARCKCGYFTICAIGLCRLFEIAIPLYLFHFKRPLTSVSKKEPFAKQMKIISHRRSFILPCTNIFLLDIPNRPHKTHSHSFASYGISAQARSNLSPQKTN